MGSLKKKLMCLGAGPSQLPLIKKAVSRGLYVITVDYTPESPGHAISHQWVDCSTTDKEKVLEAARKYEIDAIVTCASDVATPAVGYVAEKLGLPGGNSQAADIMSNSNKFRTFQRQKGFSFPEFIFGREFSDISSRIAEITPPVIFKPTDSSGSRGIVKVHEFDINRCEKAFQYAQSFSRSGWVCVEEFIEGVEVGGDGFMLNGELTAVPTHKHIRNYIPVGHELPTDISSEAAAGVRDLLAKICLELEYMNGVINFDVMVSQEGATVLEMSPRLGGNGIPVIIERGAGLDFISATIDLALGEPVTLPQNGRIDNPCGSWVIGSEKEGTLAGMASKEEIMELVPEVFDFTMNYGIGDKVPGFVHSGCQLGIALFDCPQGQNYNEVIRKIQHALRLKIIPS